MPAARAVSSLQCRNRSSVSIGASPDPALVDSAGSVREGVLLVASASRPAEVTSTTGYAPELWRARPALISPDRRSLIRSSFHRFNAPWKGSSCTQGWAVDHLVRLPPRTAATFASPTRPLNLAVAASAACTASAATGSSGGEAVRQLSQAWHRPATRPAPEVGHLPPVIARDAEVGRQLFRRGHRADVDERLLTRRGEKAAQLIALGSLTAAPDHRELQSRPVEAADRDEWIAELKAARD